jgi:hypothetical protein
MPVWLPKSEDLSFNVFRLNLRIRKLTKFELKAHLENIFGLRRFQNRWPKLPDLRSKCCLPSSIYDTAPQQIANQLKVSYGPLSSSLLPQTRTQFIRLNYAGS